MATQFIFNTVPTSNYTKNANSLITALPSKPYHVLVYLLSKPPSWRLRPGDIKKRLQMSAYSVRQALYTLQKLGYLYYKRLATGHTQWFVYSEPQPHLVTTDQATKQECQEVEPVEPHMDFQHVLDKTIDLDFKNNYTLDELELIPEPEIVVVDALTCNDEPELRSTESNNEDQLQYPEKLSESQLRAAKREIKKCKDDKLKPEVLLALTIALTTKNINNPVGYLVGLIQRANDGSFTPVSNTPQNKARIPLASEVLKQKAEAPKVDNLKYYRELFRQFGDKVLNVIPEQYLSQLSTG